MFSILKDDFRQGGLEFEGGLHFTQGGLDLEGGKSSGSENNKIALKTKAVKDLEPSSKPWPGRPFAKKLFSDFLKEPIVR